MENSVAKMMLPFKVQRLLSTIIEKKGLDIEDALGYLYSSDTYRQLSSDSPYLRRLSTANLYDMLKKGKRKKKQTRNISSDTLLFISSCIENYKEHKRMGADEVLMLFKKYDVTDYLIQGFEVLHTQGKKYIMADIDRYIKNRE